MKKFSGWICLLFGATMFWGAHAVAQNQASAQPPVPMIEIFGCTFIGDNDMDDLLAVTARWNRWADDHAITDYTALIMTPVMFSDALTADVFWLGANPSGAAFGAGLGRWMSEGADMNAEFEEVVDCASHSLFAEVILREPGGPPPEAGVVSFQDCTIHAGRSIAEAVGAGERWADYVGTNGPDVFMSQLFPVAGISPDADYNFKAVAGFESADAYGEFLSTLTGNGFAGATAAQGIFGPYVDCDSSRLYAANFVRIAAAP